MPTSTAAGPRRARAGGLDGRRLRRDRAPPHQRQPAVGQQHPDHQRRDARHRRHRDRVRPAGRRRERRLGVAAAPPRPTRSTALVTRRRRGGRGPPSPPRTRPTWSAATARRRLGRRAGRDRHPRLRRLRPGARRGLRPRAAGRPDPLRLRRPRGDHDVPRLLDRPAAAPRAADRPLRLHRQDRRPDRAAPGSAAPPATSSTSTRSPSRPTLDAAARLGARGRVDLPAGRYDTILPPTAVADLMIDAYWSAGARDAHDGQSVFSRRGGGTRIGERARPARGRPCSPTRRTRAWSARPFAVVTSSGNDELGLRQRPAAGPHRLDRATAGSPPCSRPGETAALTGQPVTPAIDNLVLEVDGATRHRRRPRRRHRARAAADLPVVHPRGRPADAAAHRADPRRRLPRRGRRDHRRGQQLPLQREPGRPAAPLHARLGDRSRRSAASGATTTSPAPRCPPCASPTSTCRASPRRSNG